MSSKDRLASSSCSLAFSTSTPPALKIPAVRFSFAAVRRFVVFSCSPLIVLVDRLFECCHFLIHEESSELRRANNNVLNISSPSRASRESCSGAHPGRPTEFPPSLAESGPTTIPSDVSTFARQPAVSGHPYHEIRLLFLELSLFLSKIGFVFVELLGVVYLFACIFQSG